MTHYQAEALFMDTDALAKYLGRLTSLQEAERVCQRHAVSLLTFKTRTPGVWKAQGSHCWYRITRQAN